MGGWCLDLRKSNFVYVVIYIYFIVIIYIVYDVYYFILKGDNYVLVYVNDIFWSRVLYLVESGDFV